MAEKIYAIPVNDAFDKDCECPICIMYRDLESDAIGFTLGPSYMDDRFRLQTDELGFCQRHMQQLYDRNNRLGLALMMSTHMAKTTRDIEALSKNPLKGGLFKKGNPVADYVKKVNHTCFVCNRVNDLFDKYIYTVIYLYKTDPNFKKKFEGSKGFCADHFALLLENAPGELSGKTLDEFNKTATQLYLDNMKRVQEDVEWFINKFHFDYRDAPWKNAKDAVIRGMIKLNGILPEEDMKTQKHYD